MFVLAGRELFWLVITKMSLAVIFYTIRSLNGANEAFCSPYWLKPDGMVLLFLKISTVNRVLMIWGGSNFWLAAGGVAYTAIRLTNSTRVHPNEGSGDVRKILTCKTFRCQWRVRGFPYISLCRILLHFDAGQGTAMRLEIRQQQLHFLTG